MLIVTIGNFLNHLVVCFQRKQRKGLRLPPSKEKNKYTWVFVAGRASISVLGSNYQLQSAKIANSSTAHFRKCSKIVRQLIGSDRIVWRHDGPQTLGIPSKNQKKLSGRIKSGPICSPLDEPLGSTFRYC